MIEITGTNSATAMMPGLPKSWSRFTPRATFDHIDTRTAAQNSSAHVWPAALS